MASCDVLEVSKYQLTTIECEHIFSPLNREHIWGITINQQTNEIYGACDCCNNILKITPYSKSNIFEADMLLHNDQTSNCDVPIQVTVLNETKKADILVNVMAYSKPDFLIRIQDDVPNSTINNFNTNDFVLTKRKRFSKPIEFKPTWKDSSMPNKPTIGKLYWFEGVRKPFICSIAKKIVGNKTIITAVHNRQGYSFTIPKLESTIQQGTNGRLFDDIDNSKKEFAHHVDPHTKGETIIARHPVSNRMYCVTPKAIYSLSDTNEFTKVVSCNDITSPKVFRIDYAGNFFVLQPSGVLLKFNLSIKEAKSYTLQLKSYSQIEGFDFDTYGNLWVSVREAGLGVIRNFVCPKPLKWTTHLHSSSGYVPAHFKEMVLLLLIVSQCSKTSPLNHIPLEMMFHIIRLLYHVTSVI